jgi:predicted nucleotidyltransferase
MLPVNGLSSLFLTERFAMPTLDEILEARTKARTERARSGALRALQALERLGVEARLIGSLARGEHRLHSDVDILIVRCPDELRYRIEGIVEDELGGLPFDVVYLDEVAPAKRPKLQHEAVGASDLR